MDIKNNIANLKTAIQKFASHPTWGLITAIVIALATNLWTVRYIYSLQTDLQTMCEKDLIGQNYIQTARIKLMTIGKEMSTLLLLKDGQEKADAIRNIFAEKSEVESFIRKSAPLYRSKRDAGVFRAATQRIAECSSIIDTLIDMSRSGTIKRARGVIVNDMGTVFAKTDSVLYKLDNMKMRHDIRLFKSINYQLSVSVIVTLLTLVFTIAVKFFVYKRASARRVRTKASGSG
jgi:Four helix bundle sensory module for signal transduction